MGIAQKINMVPFQISLGLSQGIMPLLSYNYSSGNIPRTKAVLTFAMKIALGFMITVSAFYYFGADILIRLFIENETVISYGIAFLRGFCFGLPFLCMDFVAVGFFQASGMGKKALVFAISRKILLEIPALFLLNTLFPLYGLAYAQMTTEILLAAIAVTVLIRIFRRLSPGKQE